MVRREARILVGAGAKVSLALLLFGLLFLTLVGGVLSNHKQIQRYFDLPDYVGPVPEHVRSAVLERIPLGTSLADVDRSLRLRGIGADGNSRCEQSCGKGRLTCYLGTHNHIWDLIREQYTIVLLFDSDQRLKSVEVNSMLKGPGR